jgi:hypothetical protein
MKKYTIDNFSGGIQESTSANDFSPRQWSQLKGIVPKNELTFETQWPIQTVGTGHDNFNAVFPLAASSGVYLVAIKFHPDPLNELHGSLWWTKAPSAEAAYTDSTVNGANWSRIVTAENKTWNTLLSLSANANIPVRSNPEYRFICAFPFQVYRYVKDLSTVEPLNLTLDADSETAPRDVASAVLLNTRLRGPNQQSVVLYVDNTSNSVKAVVFPAPRRLAIHRYDKVADNDSSITTDADFITADFIHRNGKTGSDTVPSWPLDMDSVDASEVAQHPYTYRDINGQLNPGSGLMPRSNVGCVKGSKLVLGDIEWRVNFASTIESKGSLNLTFGTGGATTVGATRAQVVFPNEYPATSRVLYNNGPGILYLSDLSTMVPPPNIRKVKRRVKSSNVVTLTVDSTVGLANGNYVIVDGVGPNYNGTFQLTAVTSTTIQYTFASPKATLPNRASSGTVVLKIVPGAPPAPTPHKLKIEVGQYAAIPNPDPATGAWDDVYVAASVAGTSVRAAQNYNRATHLLNDDNTGPHRGSIYYAEDDIDTWDPRSVLKPSMTDVRIAGMHTLDDTVIVITTAGSEGDGVLRVRGFFSQLHPYSEDEQPDPTSVRIELIRGGLGAPERPDTGGHKNYSCLWSESGLVVFIDRLGGVFYTNGQVCDRLDRYGPVQPDKASPDDHVAALGKHLFLYRAGRLLCFTVLSSEGGMGSGCWTEIVKPAGAIKSMVGIREDVYFVNASGQVMRIATAGPIAERGKINGVDQTLTVSTATVGSEDEHTRTSWHRFGMTFTTPTSCAVGTVRVQSTGALNTVGGVVAPNVSYSTVLNRTYSSPGVLGEFIVPAGIGQQAVASATVTFTGYVVLQSASFWVTGSTPRQGDQ